MNLPDYDHAENGVRVCKGRELYDMYIDGERIPGTFGPDVINSVIKQEDSNQPNVSQNLPAGITWVELKKRLIEFPRIPER